MFFVSLNTYSLDRPCSLEEGSLDLGLHLVSLGLPLLKVDLQLVSGEADQGVPVQGDASVALHPGALQGLCCRGPAPGRSETRGEVVRTVHHLWWSPTHVINIHAPFNGHTTHFRHKYCTL